MNYAVDTGEKPVNETGGQDGLMRRTTGRYELHPVRIENGRPLRGALSLDVEGFELVDHPTAVKAFADPDELRAVYYPEMERLIAGRTGAKRVHVFDHTLRTSDEDDRLARKIREPVKAVHNDYTAWSGPQRVRDLLPDEAEALIARRFAIVQVWRPIAAPIERNPLALIDARTVAPQDLIASERRFPDRVGEIYVIQHNPAHRWVFFPRMTRDEAIVFKVYDSETDGRARWGGHSSFDDPTTRPDAPPRESIEIRAFAFF
ncbi:MAG TPA: CmcJ/NvfI family oxidoreductase [Caulobacteraceae bacterium]|nr:CmcJ/NvfI family oxidoreductase [Caulobacteraceae bacterium]